MKKYIIPFFAALFILSCSSKKERPTTALDTGRAFIRATLDGDFDEAKTLLYSADTGNVQLFDLYKMQYERSSGADKNSYKSADIIVNTYNDLNDSTAIINYANSYKKTPLEIKVIKKSGLWQVDFKHTIGE
ncbi:hypothetical protein [Ferruginibacter albus]|uniref:hypothetical protein n=1 Tax=Ferruginibacter albus TaxID=2875540 RepID=UPI001CC35EC7|nr:hypothetical protein [Ferruginibacter albus]UAY51142.1 hypothetical protein K9M53_11135 [Ferruginibacter albus]